MNQYFSTRASAADRARREAAASILAGDPVVETCLDSWVADTRFMPPDLALVADEIRTKRVLGMLLCLGKRQRLVYILGDLLLVGSAAGSELLGMSEAAFRQTLSRVRHRLANFVADRCGLLHPGSPCRCDRNSACLGNRLGGTVGLESNSKYAQSIRDILGEVSERIGNIESRHCRELHLKTPARKSPEFASRVRKVLDSTDVRRVIEVSIRL